MQDDDIREIFRRIAAGEDPHGGFLTHFSRALGNADRENFQLLKPFALELIKKYNLSM